jgi:hypothetical protein
MQKRNNNYFTATLCAGWVPLEVFGQSVPVSDGEPDEERKSATYFLYTLHTLTNTHMSHSTEYDGGSPGWKPLE